MIISCVLLKAAVVSLCQILKAKCASFKYYDMMLSSVTFSSFEVE